MDGLILSANARTRLRKPAGGQANCQVNPQTQASSIVLRRMVCTSMSMAGFAARLPLAATDYIPENLENLVDDRTRLAGAWDFELAWTPRDQLLKAGAEAVTLQQALENIGLRLTEARSPCPCSSSTASTPRRRPTLLTSRRRFPCHRRNSKSPV